MKIVLEPGKYVVAVSGGVDSVVLLDILSHQPGLELVVAHFDHGIRPDAAEDRKFVGRLAKKYDLSFVCAEGNLGPKASEAAARKARYDFLYKVQEQSGAAAIVTAHHQDDLIETAIINLLRGTHRRGLSSLRSTESVKRPLLNVSKAELIKYAQAGKLKWHEDSTNSDEAYLRNYVRRQIVPQFSAKSRERFLRILSNAKQTNEATDALIADLLGSQTDARLGRQWFQSLSHKVAREVMAAWLSRQNIRDIDRRLLEELVVAAKTLPPGKQRDIDAGHILKVYKTHLALAARDR